MVEHLECPRAFLGKLCNGTFFFLKDRLGIQMRICVYTCIRNVYTMYTHLRTYAYTAHMNTRVRVYMYSPHRLTRGPKAKVQARCYKAF